LIVSKGGDVNGKPGTESPLPTGSDKTCPEVTDYLFSLGSNPNKTYGYSVIPFESIIGSNVTVDVIDRWIKKGHADINLRAQDGGTMLHVAAHRGASLEVIKYLLSKGVDPLVRDKLGLYAFERAPFGSDTHHFLLDAAMKRGYTPKVAPIVKTKPAKTDGVAITSASLADPELLKLWGKWLKIRKVDLNPGEIDKGLPPFPVIESLVLNLEQKKNPQAPPADSSVELQAMYKNIKMAQNAPWDLKADVLDLQDMPPLYYKKMIDAAKRPEAVVSGKFKPTAEQGARVLKLMLGNADATAKDYEAMAWIMAKSGLELTPEILKQFDIPSQELEAEIAAMLKTDAFKFKGTPNLAAIKLAKLLLTLPDADFVCVDSFAGDTKVAAKSKNPLIDEVLTWFATYGEANSADRAFFAKVARFILEQKKLCDQDKHLLLTAMKSWKSSHPSAQYDFTCAMADSLSPKPIAERSFEEMFLVATAVGLKSEFTDPAWYEQMKAYYELRAGEGGKERGTTTQDVHDGLLKHVLGAPEGVIEASDDKKKKVKIVPTNPRVGSIVKLCSLVHGLSAETNPSAETEKLLRSARFWIGELKNEIAKPRHWPKGFTAVGSSASASSLESEFTQAKMDADLEAIKTGCESVQKKALAPAKITSGPTKKAPKPKGGDFDPTAGMKKKKGK